jgi:coiled-coil domain-containing protein 39
MERNVARAQGERSQEETEKLKKDIADQEAKRKEYKSNLTQLVNSNKQLQDEKRIIERTIEKLNHQKQSLDTQIHELTLGNSMAAVDKSKVEQRKEKTLVQHDIMKLEIKRLRDTVNNGADKVYGLENRKY